MSESLYSELSLTEQVLLHLVSVALQNGEAGDPLPDEVLRQVDWAAVWQEGCHQTVQLMVLDAMACYRKYVDDALYDEWIQVAGDLFYRNAQVFGAQTELVEHLATEAFPHVILKGAAVAACYPRPELRVLGDVDFLVEQAQLHEAEARLISSGYQRLAMEHDCHVVFKKNDVRFEMHFETAGIPFGTIGQRVREFLRDTVSTAQCSSVDGVTFSVPDGVHQALILLLHMQHHTLGEGLGIRHLCDWLCFAQATKEQPFWEQRVLPFLKEIGLFTYAAVMTKIGALYLGLPCPSWAQVADDELCRKMIKDILTGGNFGQKDRKRAISSMMISEHGKGGTQHGVVYNLAHQMHRNVMLLYPIIRKIPLLYPFLYAYRVIRHSILIVCRKRYSLLKMVAPATERKAVYEQLHIFETEKQ